MRRFILFLVAASCLVSLCGQVVSPVQPVNSGTLARGLIGWWTMDTKDVGTTAATGTNMVDRSTNGNHAYLYAMGGKSSNGIVGLSTFFSDTNFTAMSTEPDAIYSGVSIPAGVVNTGLAYDPINDTFWMGNFETNSVVQVSKTGTFISSFPATGTGIQGLVYDPTDDTLWYVNAGGTNVYHVDKTGASLGGFTMLTNSNGLAYQASDDTLWVSSASGFGIRKYQTDGTFLTNFTAAVSGGNVTTVDGLLWDPSDSNLWVSCDIYMMFKVNTTNGAIVTAWPQLINNIEHMDFDTTTGRMWINNDREKHSLIVGGNKLYSYTPTGPTNAYPAIAWQTASMWIKPIVLSTARLLNRGINYARNSTGNYTTGWYMDINALGGMRFFAKGATTSQLLRHAVNGTIQTNVWQHVVLTWNRTRIATNAHWYVNGVEVTYVTTTNATDPMSTDTNVFLTIGVDEGLANNRFNGLIDDVRLYDRILTTNEILQLYQNPGASSGVKP